MATMCIFIFNMFLISRWLNNKNIIEGHGGGGGHGIGHYGGGRGYGYGVGRGRGYGYGYGRGYGYGGSSGYNYGGPYMSPLYIYQEEQPYWYRYVPFFGY